jgi:hypothetical protein
LPVPCLEFGGKIAARLRNDLHAAFHYITLAPVGLEGREGHVLEFRLSVLDCHDDVVKAREVGAFPH